MTEKKQQLKDFFKSRMARLDAISDILVEKGIVTGEELEARTRKKLAEYEGKNDLSSIVGTAPPSPASDGFVLPSKMKLIDGNIAIADPKSAAEICGNCIMQNTMDLDMVGIIDVCGIGLLFRNKARLSSKQDLNGVNPVCWMMTVAEAIIDGLEKNLFKRMEIPGIIARTATQVESAVNENISPDGIRNIINCAVVTERIGTDEADSLLKVDTKRATRVEQEQKKEKDFDDIRWNG